MSPKSKKKSELQSGNEAEIIKVENTADENAEETPKPRKGKSKAFSDNIITSTDEAKKKGKNGGVKSGEVRRNKRDAREAAKLILELKPTRSIKTNLTDLGVKDEDSSNIVAVMARLFTLSMSGNLEALNSLLRYAGYDPEENRTERESLASDKRRQLELEAKIKALGQEGVTPQISINMNDEDDNNDVVIYMPEIRSVEECEASEESEVDKAQDKE